MTEKVAEQNGIRAEFREWAKSKWTPDIPESSRIGFLTAGRAWEAARESTAKEIANWLAIQSQYSASYWADKIREEFGVQP